MTTACCPEGHIKLSSVSVGNEYGHVPGHQYHDVDTVISRKGDKYRVHVVESWGSCQGYDEEHGRNEVVARGSSISAAVAEAGRRGALAGIVDKGAQYMVQSLGKAEDEAEEADED
jgi:hypothetical protein